MIKRSSLIFCILILILLMPTNFSGIYYPTDTYEEQNAKTNTPTPRVKRDIAIMGEIYFSKSDIVSGDKVEIYVRIQNNGEILTSANVSFYIISDQVVIDTSSKIIDLTPSEDKYVKIDWIAQSGNIEIKVDAKVIDYFDDNPEDNMKSTHIKVKSSDVADFSIRSSDITFSTQTRVHETIYAISVKVHNLGLESGAVSLKITDHTAEADSINYFRINVNAKGQNTIYTEITNAYTKHHVDFELFNSSVDDINPENNFVSKVFDPIPSESAPLVSIDPVTSQEFYSVVQGSDTTIAVELTAKETDEYQVIVGGITSGIKVMPDLWKVNLISGIAQPLNVHVTTTDQVELYQTYPIEILLYRISDPSNLIQQSFSIKIVDSIDTINITNNSTSTSSLDQTSLLQTSGLTLSGLVLDELNPPIIGNLTVSPSNPNYLQNVSLGVDVTDESTIDNVTLFYSYDDGVTWENSTLLQQTIVLWTGELPTPNTEMNVTFYIQAFDNFTNSASTTQYWIYFDGTSPVVENVTQIGTVSTLDSVIIYANITDNIGQDNTTVYLNYSYDNSSYYQLQMSQFSGNLTYGLFMATIPPSGTSPVYYYIEAADISGLVGNSSIFTYSVDLLPVINSVAHDPVYPNFNTTSILISANATDNEAISEVRVFFYYNQTWYNQTMSMNVDIYETTINSTGMNSTLTYYVSVTDSFGHVVSSSQFGVNFDGTAPMIGNVSHIQYPIASQPTMIAMDLAGTSDLQNATLYYSLDNGSSWNPISIDGNGISSQTGREPTTGYHYNDYVNLIYDSGPLTQLTIYAYSSDSDTIYTQLSGHKIDGSGWEQFYLVSSGVTGYLPTFTWNSAIYDQWQIYIYDSEYNDNYYYTYDYTAIPYYAMIPATTTNTVVQYYGKVFDLANNSAVTSIYNYTSDGMPPQFSSVTNITSVISEFDSVTINATITDNVALDETSLIIYYSYNNLTWYSVPMSAIGGEISKYQGIIPATANSEVFYYLNATDMSSLTNSSGIYNYTIDTAPIVTSTTTIPLYPMADQSVQLNATLIDDNSITSVSLYYNYNGTWDIGSMNLVDGVYQYNIPASINDTTVYYIVYAEDSYGHQINSSMFSYYSDAIPPVISAISHSPNPPNADADVLVSALITDTNNIQNATLHYSNDNGTSWTNVSMSYNFGYWEGTIPAQYSQVLVNYTITAFDVAGHSTTSNQSSFLTDNISPQVWNVTTYDYVSETTGVFINATIQDNYGVDDTQTYLYYSYDNSTWYSTLMARIAGDALSGIYQSLSPASSLLAVYYYIQATDLSGRQNYSTIFNYTIDHVPVITNQTIYPLYPNEIIDVNVYANVTDDFGINSVTLYYNYSSTLYSTTTTNVTDIYGGIIPAPNVDSMVSWFYSVVDSFGHTINSSTSMYYADGISPVIGSTGYTPPQATYLTNVTVHTNIDDTNPLRNVTLYYSYDNGSSWSSTEMVGGTGWSPNVVKDVLVVSHGQSLSYLTRNGYTYDTITETAFASIQQSTLEQYRILIIEPDWSNYANLRSGLTNVAQALNNIAMVVSIRAAGNLGSQVDIDFLGTDYDRTYLSNAETFVDSSHPFITGQPWSGTTLVTSYFNSWGYTDHGFLYNRPTTQEGYTEILQNTYGVSMFEYTYKYSHILVDSLTSIDGSWGSGNSVVADNYINYLDYSYQNLQTGYVGDIPAASGDTDVTYYITATDMANNTVTSGTMSYFSDGNPPVISGITGYSIVSELDNPVINVTISDTYGVDISKGQLFYSYDNSTWYGTALGFISGTSISGVYQGIIPATTASQVYYYVNATDLYGLTSQSSIYSYVVDLLPVINNMTYYPLYPSPFNMTTITVNATDDYGIANVYVNYDYTGYSNSLLMTLIGGLYEGNITETLIDTKVNFTVSVIDSFGQNYTSQMYYYYSDGTSPIFNSLTTTPKYPNYLSNVNVTANISDVNELRNATLYYSIDGGSSWTSIQMNTNTVSGIIPAMPGETVVMYYVSATDMANNTSVSNTMTYSSDSIPPSILSISDPNVISSENPDLINVTISDGIGIDNSSVYLFFTLDNLTYYQTLMTQISGNVTYGTFGAIAPIIGSPIYYFVQASDLSGLQSTSGNYSYIIDFAPTIVSIDVLPQLLGKFSDIHFYANATDDYGINSVVLYYEYNGTYDMIPMAFISGNYTATVPAIGVNATLTYFVNVMDTYGHSVNSSQYPVYIDGLNPIIQDVLQDSQYPQNKTSVPIRVKVSDASGIANVTLYYYTDSTGWISLPLTFGSGSTYNGRDPVSGYYYGTSRNAIYDTGQLSRLSIYAYSSDSDTISITLSGNRIDTNTWEQFYSASGLTNGYLPEFTWPDFTYNMWQITMTDTELNDNFYYTYEYDVFDQWNASIPGFDADTNVTYYVRTYDNAGNFADSQNMTYVVDGISPSLNYISNVSVISANTAVQINSTISDNVGVDTSSAYLYYSYDNSTWYSTQMALISGDLNNGNYSGVIPGTTNPWMTYYLQVVDIGGYVSTSSLFNCSIDFIPVIQGVSFTPIRPNANLSTSVYVNATDDNGITSVILRYVHDGNSGTVPLIWNGTVYEGIVPATIVDTLVNLTVSVVDTFGHNVTSGIYSFYSDGITPSINDITIDPLSPNFTGNTTISANIYDSNGIMNATLFYSMDGGSTWSSTIMNGGAGLNQNPVTKDVLLVSHGQLTSYLTRNGYTFDTITASQFSTIQPSTLSQYRILILEPNWSNYGYLRSGLSIVNQVMDNISLTVSIRVAGNLGSQLDIDLLGTDYDRSYTNNAETFVDDTHPFITGQPWSGNTLLTSYFNSWGSTDHGFLYNRPTVQDGYAEILQNTYGVSMFEYNYKYSHVLVDTLTSIDGTWGSGDSLVADNYINYLNYTFYQLNSPNGFAAEIPASLNDTMVKYYIQATDLANNTATSNILEYYSDGLSPTIANVSNFDYVSKYLETEITADFSDLSGIDASNAKLYYSYDNLTWYSTGMGQVAGNTTVGQLSGLIPATLNPVIYYYLDVPDTSGLQTITQIYNVTTVDMSISLISPAEFSTLNATHTVNITFSITPNTSSVSGSTDGGISWQSLVNTVGDTFIYSLDALQLSEGQIELMINITLSPGISVLQSYSFILDRSVPQIIQFPEYNQIDELGQWINTTISDANINFGAVTTLYYSYNNITWYQSVMTLVNSNNTVGEFSGWLPQSTGQSYVMYYVKVQDSLGWINTTKIVNATINYIPVILNVTQFPVYPNAGNPILVEAEVVDDLGLQNITLIYTINSIDSFLPMTYTNGLYKASIPAQFKDLNITYFIDIYDDFLHHVTSQNYSVYIDGIAPQIENVIMSSSSPNMLQNLTITVDIVDANQIQDTVFYYSIDGGNLQSITLINSMKTTTGRDPISGDYYGTVETRDYDSGPLTRLLIDIYSSDSDTMSVRLWGYNPDLNTWTQFYYSTGLPTGYLPQFDWNDPIYTKWRIEIFDSEYNDYFSYNYEYDYQTGYQVTIPPTNQDGTVEFYFQVTDVAGNTNTSATYSYHSDGLSPSLDSISTFGRLPEAAIPRIWANISDNIGITTPLLFYSINGSTWLMTNMTLDTGNSVSGNYYFDLSVVSQGTVYYYIMLTDISGLNFTSQIYSYEVNLVPAFQLITQDPIYVQPDMNVVISASIIDDYGLNSVILHYSVNGSTYSQPMVFSSGQYRYEIPATLFNAYIEYYIIVEDDIGQQVQSSLMNYFADGVFPSVNYQVIPPAFVSNVEPVIVEVAIRDNYQIDFLGNMLYYSYDNSTWYQVIMTLTSGTSTSAIFQGLIPVGLSTPIYYYVVGSDIVGHEVQLPFMSFGIDAAPVLNSINQDLSFPVVGDSVTLHFNITDNLGVTTVDVFYDVEGGSSGTISATEISPNIFEVVFQQNVETEIEYYVQFEDTFGTIITTPSQFLYYDNLSPQMLLVSEDPLHPHLGENGIVTMAVYDKSGIPEVNVTTVLNGGNNWQSAPLTTYHGLHYSVIKSTHTTNFNNLHSADLQGSDISKEFGLPFDFPFYSKVYTSLFVSTNGYLVLNQTVDGIGSGSQLLQTYPSIALSIDNFATSVFVTNSSDQVRISWYGAVIGSTPDQKLMTLVLHSTGLLEFVYNYYTGGIAGIGTGTGNYLALSPVTSQTYVLTNVYVNATLPALINPGQVEYKIDVADLSGHLNSTSYSYVIYDTDSDGLSDWDEINLYHSNPYNNDSDADGLLDYEEVMIYRTNATNNDTDYDTMPDFYEVQNQLDPTVDDSLDDLDSDLLTNIDEFKAGTLPYINDTDSDGMLDGYEVKYNLDPFANDASLDPDSDGLTNLEESKIGTNPNKKDTDGDEMPDKWEVDNNLNPLINDQNQDPDSDNILNIGEFKYGTDPHNPDTDSDGMKDGWEINNDLNPLVDDAQLDSDSDGLVNIDEFTNHTNPNNPDTDGDGMPDGWEVDHDLDPLVNDADLDPDSDGFTNIQEYLQNSDPQDPEDPNANGNDRNNSGSPAEIFVVMVLLFVGVGTFVLRRRRLKKKN